jgi:acyl carrier protein
MGQHVVVAQVAGDAIGGSTAAAAADAAQTTVAAPTVVSAPAWRERFDSTVPDEQIELLRELVRDQVMHILRLDPASPPSLHDRLMDLGMDSLMAVQLRNGLSRALQLPRALPSTLMFDYPTIDAIASHLLQRLNPAAPSAPAVSAPAVALMAPMKAADVAAMSDDDISRLLDERWGNR